MVGIHRDDRLEDMNDHKPIASHKPCCSWVSDRCMLFEVDLEDLKVLFSHKGNMRSCLVNGDSEVYPRPERGTPSRIDEAHSPSCCHRSGDS